MKAILRIFVCLAVLAASLQSHAQTPNITVQPQDATNCAGGNVSFSVEILYEPTVYFYWVWKGLLVTQGVVSSETNSSVTLSNVQSFDDLTQIYVHVSTPGGGIQSSNAYLHVPDPWFCTQSADTSVPVGGTIQFQAHANGTPPLSYRWWFQKFASFSVMQLTNNARISGADSPSLTISNAIPPDAGTYWATVTNWYGSIAISTPAKCSVGPPPTVTNLMSRIVRIYNNTTFIPTYTGGAPRTYQWYRNDVLLPGAINQVLTVPNSQRPDVGLYHVVVSNPGGSATSEKAHLQIRISLEGTTPIFREEATDEMPSLTNAVVASFVPPPTAVFHGVPLLFSTYNATTTVGEGVLCGVPVGRSMWVVYTSPRTETTSVRTEGSDFDTVLAVYTWDGNPNHAPDFKACDNNGGYDGQDSALSFPATIGQNYYIVVAGVNGAYGTARLQVGQNIRKPSFNRLNGSFRFELAGEYWYDNILRHKTGLLSGWSVVRTIPATNSDWIIGYTNSSALLDAARYYSVVVNTNSAPP